VYNMTSIHGPRDSTHRYPRQRVRPRYGLLSAVSSIFTQHLTQASSSFIQVLSFFKPHQAVHRDHQALHSSHLILSDLFVLKIPNSGKRTLLRDQVFPEYKPSPRGLSALIQRHHQWASSLIFSTHPPPLFFFTPKHISPFFRIFIWCQRYVSYKYLVPLL
jgi:hypothetical protein